jgi:hypothetical protein
MISWIYLIWYNQRYQWELNQQKATKQKNLLYERYRNYMQDILEEYLVDRSLNTFLIEHLTDRKIILIMFKLVDNI